MADRKDALYSRSRCHSSVTVHLAEHQDFWQKPQHARLRSVYSVQNTHTVKSCPSVSGQCQYQSSPVQVVHKKTAYTRVLSGWMCYGHHASSQSSAGDRAHDHMITTAAVSASVSGAAASTGAWRWAVCGPRVWTAPGARPACHTSSKSVFRVHAFRSQGRSAWVSGCGAARV
jgi:hypothetical protein